MGAFRRGWPPVNRRRRHHSLTVTDLAAGQDQAVASVPLPPGDEEMPCTMSSELHEVSEHGSVAAHMDAIRSSRDARMGGVLKMAGAARNNGLHGGEEKRRDR